MSSKTSTNPNSPTQDEPLIMKDIQFDTFEIEKNKIKISHSHLELLY